jgi:tetratricopeptide (TPR) repeat protein
VSRKITRKELREPDQFHTISERVMIYLLENRKKFYLASSIVVLVVLIVCGWYLYTLSYENRADKLYSSAFNSYSGTFSNDGEKLSSAVKIYEEITKKYPSSRAAALSFYNMGNIFFALKETDKSIEAYNSFLETSSEDNVLTLLAYYGLGHCYEEKGDYPGALESFESSNRNVKGTHFNVINYSNIARIYEKMNKPDMALEYYKKVIEQTEDPFVKTLVNSKIANLS